MLLRSDTSQETDTAATPDASYSETMELDLSTVEPSLAGPKRPQDRVPLARAAASFAEALDKEYGKGEEAKLRVPVKDRNFDLGHGDVVIAAITSCTNTSNPSVMLGAGLLARNAVERGLNVPVYVKTSLAPGSQVAESRRMAACSWHSWRRTAVVRARSAMR